MISFILDQGGRTGLANMIRTYSILGKDELARQYIEQLYLLSEALVYPNYKFYSENCYKRDRISEVVEIVENSKKEDWIKTGEENEMVYINDPRIKINWNEIDRDHPFSQDWAINHPDKSAYKVDYTISYNNIIISKFSLVYVDGFRALLPIPESNVIPYNKYCLALLFNYKETLDDYIIRSGLTVE